MAYGNAAKEAGYVTRQLVLRRLSKGQEAQCETLRREAGRCWSDLVTMHKTGREQGQWISVREMEQHSANGYALHSQTIQALAQRLDTNLQTAKALRERQATAGGDESVTMQYPYRTPTYQTVTWKDMAIRMLEGHIVLSSGRGRPPLRLALPAEYHQADIRRAELTWRADHYELCLTIAAAAEMVETEDGAGSVGKETAGIDLGEIHIAAVATTRRQAFIISGRLLRSCKRLRNKRHGAYSSLLAHCTPGSRRARQLRKRKRQASATLVRQQRDVLHQASRKVVTYCQEESVGRIFVGDVRDVQDGVHRGANNQKIAQWPHGQFYDYLVDKARRNGIHVGYIDEGGSTITCSACGQRQMSAPRRRTARCTGCGVLHHRDANGAANICSRGCYGQYGLVGVERITHRRPIAAGRSEGYRRSSTRITAKQLSSRAV